MKANLSCKGYIVSKDGKYLGFRRDQFGYTKHFYRRPLYPYVCLGELKVRDFYEDKGCTLIPVAITIKEISK